MTFKLSFRGDAIKLLKRQFLLLIILQKMLKLMILENCKVIKYLDLMFADVNTLWVSLSKKLQIKNSDRARN